MNEALMMQQAVMKRIDQLIVSPDEQLPPSRWKKVLDVSPDNLRRLFKFDEDYRDVIIFVGGDQRTTRARYWRCLDRAAERARRALLEKSLSARRLKG
ncbi:MAG TPA: hypothetical protein VGM92_15510 [Candidatus Kapabacteria bacterium]|jgi:hypothetical protein